MKKIVALSMLLFCSLIFAQNKTNHYPSLDVKLLGIDFGASKDDVVYKLRKASYAPRVTEAGDFVSVKNFKINSTDISLVIEFHEGKFMSYDFQFPSTRNESEVKSKIEYFVDYIETKTNGKISESDYNIKDAQEKSFVKSHTITTGNSTIHIGIQYSFLNNAYTPTMKFIDNELYKAKYSIYPD